MYNILGLIYKDKIIETRSPSTSVYLAPVRVCLSHQHWCAPHTNTGVPLTLMGCEYHIASWALNILFLSNPFAFAILSQTRESMPNALETVSAAWKSIPFAIEMQFSYDAYGKINTYRTDLRDRNLNIVQQQNSGFTYQNTHSTAFAPVSSYDSVSNTQTSYTFGINGSLRTKATPEKTEYYLFNALNNLKVYSDNGESYGYYGYDANGERTYKIKYNTVSSRVNRYGEVTKTLETEKITYYPNGYINIDQSGNYTKHYYADDLRVASKIGSGNNNESLNATVDIDFFRCQDSYNARMEELGQVIIPAETMNPLALYDEVSTLNGNNSSEDELFFYHGNHLSSVQMITDMNKAVKQGAVYAPFGEVLYEYDAYWKKDTIPQYLFNGKELDEESGMYYYSARYYAPPVFISRDALFEKMPFMSPYAYTNNNPVNRIDPDGNWSKKVHHQMVRIAVSEMVRDGELKMSKSEAKAMIKGMQKGSDISDGFLNGNQSSEKSYIHYMREPGQSVQEAKKESQKYINDNISDFKETGNYESLGQASHTMMDAACPSHADKNGDPGVNDLGLSPTKWKEHLEGDKNPTTSQLGKGVSNVKNVIREGLGLKNNNNPNQEQGKGVWLIDQ